MQSILCGYDNISSLLGGCGGGGMPYMPHSIGSIATDWLRGICKRFHNWSQCCHFLDVGSIVQVLKGV